MADLLLGIAELDDDTTFDEIWVWFHRNYDWILAIVAVNADEPVASVPKSGSDQNDPVDNTHAAYTIARDAIVDGSATLKFYFGPQSSRARYAYEKDDVPIEYQHFLRRDSFSDDVKTQEQQVEDVRWSELTFFRYDNATDIAVPVPSLEDGDVDGLIEDMETGGWYQATADAYTNKGTNTILRTAVVSYEYVGATDTATVNVSIIPRDNIRYSTDGVNFTDDPPSDADDITHLEITAGGETADFTIKPATELVNPVERLISEVYPPWQSSLSTPQVNSFAGADFNRLYALQLHQWEAPSWSDIHTVVRAGFSPLIPIDEIQLTSPQLIGQEPFSNHDDRIEGNVGYYVLRFGRTESQGQGKVELFQVNSDDLADYDDGYSVWLICFESYPVSELHEAISASATIVEIRGTARGISVDDILFVNDEQIEVDITGTVQADGDDIVTSFTVTRGVNGTTAVAHSEGDTIRAILNADRIRNIVFFGSRNQSVPQPLRILGYKRPLEVV